MLAICTWEAEAKRIWVATLGYIVRPCLQKASGWGYSSVVEFLLSICVALGSNSSITKQNNSVRKCCVLKGSCSRVVGIGIWAHKVWIWPACVALLEMSPIFFESQMSHGSGKILLVLWELSCQKSNEMTDKKVLILFYNLLAKTTCVVNKKVICQKWVFCLLNREVSLGNDTCLVPQ
jgi:hypothetical protein